MTGRDEIERALAELVREATFDIPEMGSLSAADLRRRYSKHGQTRC